MAEPTIQEIDQWRVMDELGRGDFATVHRVQSDEGEFALKLCAVGSRAGPERMQREEAALRRLDHPNIPRFVQSGSYDGRPYVVMSLARGETLKAAIEQHERGGALHGDIHAMKILEKLLEAVAHVHEQNLVHRDIKDANVLIRSSGPSVTLIDFGFCKSANMSEIISSDSFFRVGAPRFSPPAKLDNPGLAVAVHDVFAVGVIGYRLLTGDYPWSVGRTEDYGALRQLQLNQPLVPVVVRNSHVAAPASELITRLLRIDDSERPTATEALDEVRRFLTLVRSSPKGISRAKTNLAYPHARLDPIYGDIRLTNYEKQVLDTREMQRLRFIKQLGLTNSVYDSAEHSRLSHSVGCVARVEQILRTIEDQEGIKIDDELRLTARLYALTHDVTHIPFGHTLEDEFSFFPRHDNNGPRTERLIFRASSELGQVLRDDEVGRTVKKLFEPDASPTGAVVDLVSGLTGADVLDYIDRDSYFCGLAHRVDSAIFRQFRLQPPPRTEGRRLISTLWDQYGVRLDREFAVESLLEQRYAMFLKVYAHRTKIAVSALLAKGLTEALYPSGAGRPIFREENLEELGVGDTVVLDRMRQSRKVAVKLAADQIVSRRLPVGVYRAVLLERADRTEQNYLDRQHRLKEAGLFDPRSRATLEAEIARTAKLDANQVMIYCPSRAPGYRRVEHWVSSARDASPTRQEPAFGLQVARRHLGLWELWVFVAHGVEDRAKGIVMDLAQAKFGFSNMIGVDRRQGRLW